MQPNKSGLRSEERGARKTLRSVVNSILNPRSSILIKHLAIRLGEQTTFAKSLVINPQSLILKALPLCLAGALFSVAAFAGAQREEALSASVRAVLQRSVSDQASPKLVFNTRDEANRWLDEMSRRLQKRIPDTEYRIDFLGSVHYEANRAGLDPQMVLGLIEVESGFKKYAVSKAGARGYMQVMPFWVKEIGATGHNLFHLRTNLRYGCTILRHYLDMENGDLYRALGRYNGSLGRPEYPNLVLAAWRNKWALPPYTVSQSDTGTSPQL